MQKTVLPRCTPDFVLPRHRIAVYVDGCFWHGCPVHGPKEFRGPNRDRWATKLDQNRSRDRRNTLLLEDAGWTVLRFWECQVRDDLEGCVLAVADHAGAAARERPGTGDTAVRAWSSGTPPPD